MITFEGSYHGQVRRLQWEDAHGTVQPGGFVATVADQTTHWTFVVSVVTRWLPDHQAGSEENFRKPPVKGKPLEQLPTSVLRPEGRPQPVLKGRSCRLTVGRTACSHGDQRGRFGGKGGEKKPVDYRDFQYEFFLVLQHKNIIWCKLIKVIKSNVSERQALVWVNITLTFHKVVVTGANHN